MFSLLEYKNRITEVWKKGKLLRNEKKHKTMLKLSRRKSNGKYYYWNIENRKRKNRMKLFCCCCFYFWSIVEWKQMENLVFFFVFNQLLMSEIMLQLHDFSLTFFICFSFYTLLIMKTGISGQTNKKKLISNSFSSHLWNIITQVKKKQRKIFQRWQKINRSHWKKISFCRRWKERKEWMNKKK